MNAYWRSGGTFNALLLQQAYGAVSNTRLTLGRPQNDNNKYDDEFCRRSGSGCEKETLDLSEMKPGYQAIHRNVTCLLSGRGKEQKTPFGQST